MSFKTINISLPSDLVNQIDVLARKEFTSRSDIIRASLLSRVSKSQREAEKDIARNLALLDKAAAGLEDANFSEEKIDSFVRELRGKQ